MESIINELARKDNFTNDKQYNSGLMLIIEMGYCHVSGEPELETDIPVWTDEHIAEIVVDFYLIPREVIDGRKN